MLSGTRATLRCSSACGCRSCRWSGRSTKRPYSATTAGGALRSAASITNPACTVVDATPREEYKAEAAPAARALAIALRRIDTHDASTWRSASGRRASASTSASPSAHAWPFSQALKATFTLAVLGCESFAYACTNFF